MRRQTVFVLVGRALSTATSSHSAAPVGLCGPAVKLLLLNYGLESEKINKSGPKGNLLKSDVLQFVTAKKLKPVEHKQKPQEAPAKPRPQLFTNDVEIMESYYLTSEIRIDKLTKIREKLNKLQTDASTKISLNDFIIKATALACVRVPEASSAYEHPSTKKNPRVDVSFAVNTASGYLTPVVANAHAKGIADISREVHALSERARDGKLAPHELEGGTFTVSNLGPFGSVAAVKSIIDRPQPYVLSIAGVENVMVEDEKEGYCASKILRVTLTCHPLTAGEAAGLTWLEYFKQFLEEPDTMLL